MTQAKQQMISIDGKLDQIDEIAKVAPVLRASGTTKDAIQMVAAMQKLRELITGEVLEKMLELQGSSIGFRTDKDTSGGYPGEIVRAAFIESVMRGLRPIGNEWNIIAGRCYVTREGFMRLVRDLDGFSDLKITEGKLESVSQGGCYVPMRAEWMLNGKKDSIEVAIPVRINAGMGQDAILGKAHRKLLKRIYERVTGSVQSEPDDELEIEPTSQAVVVNATVQ